MEPFGLFSPGGPLIRILAVRPKRPQVVLRPKRTALRAKRGESVELTTPSGRTKDDILTILEHLHHHRECCCKRCKEDGNPIPRPGCCCPTCHKEEKP